MTIDKNTIALLHFENSSIKDECGNTWQVYGNPVLTSDCYKFGKQSLLLDGVDDYLSISSLDLSASDFSIDFWVYYYKNYTNNIGRAIFSTANDIGFSPFSIRGSTDNGTLIASYMTRQSAWDISCGDVFSYVKLNTWVHYYIGRSGNILYLAENGIIKHTYSVSGTINGLKYPLLFGKIVTDGTQYLHACLDELRISNIARWTSNFTPPRTQYGFINTAYEDNKKALYGYL